MIRKALTGADFGSHFVFFLTRVSRSTSCFLATALSEVGFRFTLREAYIARLVQSRYFNSYRDITATSHRDWRFYALDERLPRGERRLQQLSPLQRR